MFSADKHIIWQFLTITRGVGYDRYPHLYGSDDRVFACMSELGVSLTKESGFHQVRLISQ